MNLYSYVVLRDYGFAPNPFFGWCTLATCKPVIRRCAQIGDWVVGTGSKKHAMGGRLIYAVRVGETLTFDQYWRDTRFRAKRPRLNGSLKQAFGDNIYHRDPANERWCQEKSHHSHRDGQINRANVRSDTQVDRVLVSDWFVYFGKEAVEIPARFQRGKEENVVRQGRGHLVKFVPGFKEEFIRWVLSLGQAGYRGEPLKFRAQLNKQVRRRT